MRKIRFYIETFKIPIILIIVGLIIYFGLNINLQFISQNKKEDFLIQLLATLIGVGISVFIAESFKKIQQRERTKKSFGILKSVTINYLKDRTDELSNTIKQYKDICDVEHAESFLRLVSGFNQIALVFDKKWMDLIYSQDFLDVIETDNQFNKITESIAGTLSLIANLSLYAINAKEIITTPKKFQNGQYSNLVVNKSREIRDNIMSIVLSLEKDILKLEEEMDILFIKTGINYLETNK